MGVNRDMTESLMTILEYDPDYVYWRISENRYPHRFLMRIFMKAAEYGHFELVELLLYPNPDDMYERTPPNETDVNVALENAVEKGHSDIVDILTTYLYLSNMSVHNPNDLFIYAVEGDDVDSASILVYYIDMERDMTYIIDGSNITKYSKSPVITISFYEAVINGSLNILNFLHEEGYIGKYIDRTHMDKLLLVALDMNMDYADILESVRWILYRYTPPRFIERLSSVMVNDTTTLRYLKHHIDKIFDEEDLREAIFLNNIDVVRYMVEYSNIEIGEEHVEMARRYGHEGIMKLLHNFLQG